MRVKHICVLLWCVVSLQNVNGQSSSVVPFQQKAIMAFSSDNKTPLSVSMSGSAVWMAGSQREQGTIQLEVSSNGATNESWSFSKVSHLYVQGPVQDPNRNCVYTDANAKQHTVLGSNCLQFVPWFFPAFVLGPSLASTITATDETSATDSSKGQDKLAYSLNITAPSVETESQSNEAMLPRRPVTATIYYDSQTALANRLVYQQMLDGDELRSIDVSVEFSDYRLESGFMIPHRIKRFVQRTLQVDFNVTAVTIQ